MRTTYRRRTETSCERTTQCLLHTSLSYRILQNDETVLEISVFLFFSKRLTKNFLQIYLHL